MKISRSTVRTMVAAICAMSICACSDINVTEIGTSTQASDVSTAIENRKELDGKTVLIDGFMMRMRGYYFVSDARRIADENSPFPYDCFSDQNYPIWFHQGDVAPTSRSRARNFPDKFGSGNRVILRAVLRSIEPVANDDSEFTNLPEFVAVDLAARSQVRLENVDILEVFEEQCGR